MCSTTAARKVACLVELFCNVVMFKHIFSNGCEESSRILDVKGAQRVTICDSKIVGRIRKLKDKYYSNWFYNVIWL